MREAIRRAMPEKEEEMISSASRAKFEAGRVEGRTEGRMEGRSETLLRQLTRKFGSLPPELQQRVQQASLPELDLFLDRILDAKSIENVFADHP